MNRSPPPFSCGKISYASAHDAAKAMAAVLRRAQRGEGRQKTQVYFCEICGAHHFGRAEKSKPRRRAMRCDHVAR